MVLLHVYMYSRKFRNIHDININCVAPEACRVPWWQLSKFAVTLLFRFVIVVSERWSLRSSLILELSAKHVFDVYLPSMFLEIS